MTYQMLHRRQRSKKTLLTQPLYFPHKPRWSWSRAWSASTHAWRSVRKQTRTAANRCFRSGSAATPVRVSVALGSAVGGGSGTFSCRCNPSEPAAAPVGGAVFGAALASGGGGGGDTFCPCNHSEPAAAAAVGGAAFVAALGSEGGGGGGALTCRCGSSRTRVGCSGLGRGCKSCSAARFAMATRPKQRQDLRLRYWQLYVAVSDSFEQSKGSCVCAPMPHLSGHSKQAHSTEGPLAPFSVTPKNTFSNEAPKDLKKQSAGGLTSASGCSATSRTSLCACRHVLLS